MTGAAQDDLWSRARTVRYGPRPRPCAAGVALGPGVALRLVEPVGLIRQTVLAVAMAAPLDEEEET